MHLLHFCIWLQHTAVGTLVRKSTWLFPAVESFHIVGLAFVIGAISRLDARLIGLYPRSSVSEVAKASMPWAWGGFLLSVSTGAILFSSEAEGLYSNRAFRLKLLMLFLIGVNAAVYEFFTRRNLHRWDAGTTTPVAAKLTGIISMTLWICVVIAGRWIAYA